MNYIKLFEDGSTEATAELPTWGEISTTGDYHIDGLWYDKTGVLYTNQFTYLSNKGKLAGIEVANGIPVDIHYDELAPTLVEDTIKTSNLVVTDGFDLGQSWVNVTASRALDVTYTNDTGKPIKIVGEIQSAGTGGYGAALYINNIVIQLPIQYSLNLGYKIVISEIIPNGDTYKISDTSGTLTRWSELR